MIHGKGKYFAGAILLLGGFAGTMYVTNAAPREPRVEASSKPYIVKVHAQWCPVCMMTRGVWNEIHSFYAGRVSLVVFDVTSGDTVAASRTEARRLGLGAFFDDHSDLTGTIYILDGRTKALIGRLHGDRDFAHYRTAIDEALRATH